MSDQWIAMPRYKLRRVLVKKILQRESLKGKTCLEIGYGAGDMLSMYAHMGLRVDGYDFSPMAYQIAQKKISDNIKLFQTESDIKKNAYDYLMAFEVLEHIQDDKAALKKFRSYLRSNGKILLSMPAHMSKWGANDECTGHYRRYDRKELSIKLISAELKPLFIWNYGYPLTLLLDPMLHKTHDRYMESKTQRSREELSRESGVKRKRTILNQVVSSDILLFPFYILQEFFLNSDLGSGYIVFAKKIN